MSEQHEQRRHTEAGLERKQQLLDAAETMFAARGYAATRIADICTEAGVAKGLFYWYFPTKQALFEELVRTMRQHLRRAQAAAMAADADPLERIVQGTQASVRFIAEHRNYFAVLDMERADPDVADVLREGSDVYVADVIRLVIEAQRDGRVAVDDPQLAAVGVLGAVTSFTQALRNGRLEIGVDELATEVGQWVCRALGGDQRR